MFNNNDTTWILKSKVAEYINKFLKYNTNISELTLLTTPDNILFEMFFPKLNDYIKLENNNINNINRNQKMILNSLIIEPTKKDILLECEFRGNEKMDPIFKYIDSYLYESESITNKLTSASKVISCIDNICNNELLNKYNKVITFCKNNSYPRNHLMSNKMFSFLMESENIIIGNRLINLFHDRINIWKNNKSIYKIDREIFNILIENFNK